MAIRKLAISEFLAHKVRVALTVAAIALAVSLVVSVTSGYASFDRAIEHFVGEYMGTADAIITRIGNYQEAAIPESLLDELRADPDVRTAIGRVETESKMRTPKGEFRNVSLIGVRLPEDSEVANLKLEPSVKDHGEWFQSSRGRVAVIDQEAAEIFKTKVGGEITLPAPGSHANVKTMFGDIPLPFTSRGLNLKVVGIVHKPGILAQYMPAVYVPLDTLQEFSNFKGTVNRISVYLKPGADDAAFGKRWEAKLLKQSGQFRLRLARDNRKDIDRNLKAIHMLSYLGGTISMLAATFIVFTTLSMGVTERQRILAMLRAIGAQRWQVGRLVIYQAMLLAVTGALIGVPLGYLWVSIVGWKFPELFPYGVVLSPGGVLFGAGGTIVASLAAAFLPAWSAMRVSPLEGMTPLSRRTSPGAIVRCAFIGAALLCVDPFLLFTKALPHQAAFWGHFFLGLPCLMLGYFLLSPAFVIAVERTFGWAIAKVMAIDFSLVRQQLSGSLWRAAGTASALMVGLSVLVVLQVQGKTVLGGWKLPTQFPDMFVLSPMSGLNDKQVDDIRKIPGVKEVMPIAVYVAGLPPDYWLVGVAIMPDATMFIGIDPDMAFDMMSLDFRNDNGKPAGEAEKVTLAAYAKARLKEGRHIIVTQEYQELKHIRIGDKIPLKKGQNSDETVDYTVCGIIWSPGIDVMVAVNHMDRQFDQRSVASVFGTLADAKRDFGVNSCNLFAINLDASGQSKEKLEKSIQKAANTMGLKCGDVREIKYRISQAFNRLLNLVSTVALAAMAVASLGVVNTIIASIRTRRWQIGILRSIGLTRWQLMRLIIAESLLLGGVGAALGFTAGMQMSFDAGGLSKNFLGYGPPMIIPWTVVLSGVLSVIATAVLAAIWPAASTARTEPLELLQAGRAAT